MLEKDYKAIGSVRSEAKGEKLRAQFGENFEYEIVEQLEAEGAFDKALQNHPEVSAFLHTVSPVAFDTNEIERDIVNPAVCGAKNALEAIKKHGPQFKKVVFASSLRALANPDYTGSAKLNEDSWGNLTIEQAKENGDIACQSINPSWVFGPQAFDEDVEENMNYTASIVDSLLKLKPESSIPNISGSFIEVRD